VGQWLISAFQETTANIELAENAISDIRD